MIYENCHNLENFLQKRNRLNPPPPIPPPRKGKSCSSQLKSLFVSTLFFVYYIDFVYTNNPRAPNGFIMFVLVINKSKCCSKVVDCQYKLFQRKQVTVKQSITLYTAVITYSMLCRTSSKITIPRHIPSYCSITAILLLLILFPVSLFIS